MVWSEARRVGYADWQVGEDGEQTVRVGGLEGQVVAYFMDGEEDVLVGCRADYVCRKKERPGEEGGVAEEVSAENLEDYYACDDWDCERLGTAELQDL